MTLFGTFSAFSVPIYAASTSAYDILTTSKYAKVYTISTSGKTIPYTSKYLSTRGTVTYGKSSSAYIDNKNDELYLALGWLAREGKVSFTEGEDLTITLL